MTKHEFLRVLEEALAGAENSETGDLLEVYQMAMLLGFRGRYGDQELALKALLPNQHFTQPRPRFSEATLVKELEENGIGRPSTYANILSTIQGRDYVQKEKRRFFPTELGFLVNDLMVASFDDIMDVGYHCALLATPYGRRVTGGVVYVDGGINTMA